MKTRMLTLISPLIVLALTLTIAIAYAEGDTAGLGVSDYEAHPNITVGHTQKFAVARVSNQGTLNLTITSLYIPNNITQTGITLIFTPNTTTLAPQENVIIYGEVTEAAELGTYQGMVEFKTVVALPEGYVGNPSTPGGSAKITVSIVEASQPIATSWFNLGWFNIVNLSVISAIVASSITIPSLVYYRHNHPHVKPFKPNVVSVKQEPTPNSTVSVPSSEPAISVASTSKEDEDINDILRRMMRGPEEKV